MAASVAAVVLALAMVLSAVGGSDAVTYMTIEQLAGRREIFLLLKSADAAQRGPDAGTQRGIRHRPSRAGQRRGVVVQLLRPGLVQRRVRAVEARRRPLPQPVSLLLDSR